MKKNYLHLTVDNTQSFNRPALSEALNKAFSVVEYTPGAFLIDTDQGLDFWDSRLRAAFGQGVEFFLFEAEISAERANVYPHAVQDFIRTRNAA